MRPRHFVLASLAFAARLSAQDSAAVRPPSELRVGSRIRIATAGAPAWRAGTIAALTPDTLRLRGDDGRSEVPVALGTITALELSTGQHTRVLKSAGIGAAVGAGAGVLVSLFVHDDPDDAFQYTTSEKAMVFGAVFGVIGLVSGAIGGVAYPRDDWAPVAIPLRTSRSSPWSGTMLGIGVSVVLR